MDYKNTAEQLIEIWNNIFLPAMKNENDEKN